MEAILRGSSPRYSRDQGEFDRAIGFVDATFALALTLLVTTLDVDHPRVAFSSLGALDDAVGQQFVAFAIAFAVIASYWLQHHRLIASFAAIDYAAMVVNLFLIAAIVLLPFSTQAVGDPGDTDLSLPTVIMAVNSLPRPCFTPSSTWSPFAAICSGPCPARVRSRTSWSTRLRPRSSSPPRCRSPT
jgi:hypothetical protein